MTLIRFRTGKRKGQGLKFHIPSGGARTICGYPIETTDLGVEG